ncbi:MAG TPA: NAD(P)/FAD-dependent oxidoreductase [Candidatus Sulfotelmatobacter sp.]|nr:NAD(P)/FAD-dependent oxidoreductase [Candidatus Sulfotelmatobacter sp.]
MNRTLRRTISGSVAGALASAALVLTLGHAVLSIAFGIAIGISYALLFSPSRGAYVDNVMAGAALGLPWWGLINIIALPVFASRTPQWDADQMRAQVPALVGWVVYGSIMGLLVQVFTDLLHDALGPEPPPLDPSSLKKTRVVILGGGFGGMQTALCLEQEFHTNPGVSFSLVSDTNALLFTPMLAEVAGSNLEPSHISTPLRSSLHRTEFTRARVVDVDLDRRRVILATDSIDTVGPNSAEPDPGETHEISYDHLVFALGSVSNYLGMADLEKYSFNFKSLIDAIRIRNHVIEMFEKADRETDPARRRAMLTFVIAGGGFAGVELAGALNDFAHGILADYPRLLPADLSVILVHAHDRILPELSESLARYALQRMSERGVVFRLKVRLVGAKPGVVVLSDGEIQAETLVWTAGVAPNPVVKNLGLPKDKRGALTVDATLGVTGHAGIWALGDCAAVFDAKTTKPCPPTAQFALREAAVLARNIRAQVDGRPLKPFHFNSLGSLCVVGHQTACAELTIPFAPDRAMQFSGLFAWAMWRGIYLAKLPGIEQKIRVLMDWAVELFFPPDIVQTIELKSGQ